MNKAREAAEALFTTKKQVERTEAPTSAPSVLTQVEQHAHREPRIFAISSAIPVAENFVEEAVGQNPKPKRGTSRRRVKIPAAQHDRVRTLVMYGMTFAEVADLYGVPVDVIERIVGAEADDHSQVIE
jgi:hypothetical protein